MANIRDENYNEKINFTKDFKEMIHSIFLSEGVPKMDMETIESICDDTKQAIKLIIQQSMKFADKNNHISMTVDDVKLGMKSKGVLPLYGFSMIQDSKDRVIDLHDIINEPLPKVPRECSLKGEYLAIEGVNPRMKKLQTYDDNNNNIDPGYDDRSMTSSSDEQSSRKRKHGEEVEFAEILIPHLTSEQEQFISNTISWCMDPQNDNNRSYALDCLRTGVCINPFLSNFVNFIKRSVKFNVVRKTNFVKLIYLMKMCQALLDNKTIVWESHLDDVVESLVSCLIYTTLKADDQQMLTFRNFVINLLKHIFHTFKQARVLESRVCNILSATLEDAKISFDIQYVALRFLSEMGHETKVNYILPHTKRLSEKISSLKEKGNLTPEGKKLVVLFSSAIKPIILKTKNLSTTLEEFQEEYGFEVGSKLFNDLRQAQHKRT